MYYPDRERGLCLLYQHVHGDWSSSFHYFPHMADLLLDVPKTLLPRPLPYLRLIKGGSIPYVVPTRNPLIAVLSWGLIRIRLLDSTSFSFSVNVTRNVVVLSFFLRPLHLSGEFFQVSQQTLVGETERLHLVSIGLYSF